MLKYVKGILIIAVISAGGYYTYSQTNPAPCSTPIEYSLGTVNPGFNLTEPQFLNEIEAAAEIWSSSIGRELFKYNPKGELKVNLIYDYRQQSTNQLKSLGTNIETSQESYNELRGQYQSLLAEYNQRKQALEASADDYARRQKIYNEQIKFWNAQGGAPAEKYQELQTEKSQLETQRSQIEAEQENLKQLVDRINTVVAALNQLSQALNLDIAQYNNVGDSLGDKFEEGVYVEDESGKRIDIFEFQNNIQLTRLIAHELGHALGIDHVEDSEAIMNWLNTSTNLVPTASDIEALKIACKIK